MIGLNSEMVLASDLLLQYLPLKNQVNEKLNQGKEKAMKHIAITFLFCLLAVSAHSGTFRDDFEDGNLDEWGEVLNLWGGTSEWKIEDGVLVCRRPDAPSTFLLFGEKDWKNYSIEFDAKMVQVLSNK